MNEIQEWFSAEGDYNSGLLLFVKYSRSRGKINYLQRKCDAPKLRYELEKLAGVNCEQVAPKVAALSIASPSTAFLEQTPVTIKPDERLGVILEGKIKFRDMPEPLQKIYSELCEQYRLMRSMHEKIKLAADDASRAGYLAQLLKLEDANRQGWHTIDHWAATGELPAVKDSTPETPQTPTPKELNAARTSVTRNLQLLQNCTDEQKRNTLIEKLRSSTAIVAAAGCGFGKNADLLNQLGLIEKE